MSQGIDITRVLVRSVVFNPDNSVVLEYCIPAQDARANGVVLNHVLSIPYGDDYDNEIDDVLDVVLHLISDVLEDLPHLEPIRPHEPASSADDEDDEDDDDDDDD